MSTNELQGDFIGLFISTVLLNPQPTDWKEVVCAENTGADGSRDVVKKRTKCGIIKGFGPIDWSIKGSGTTNTAPGAGTVSGNQIAAYTQNETQLLFKIANKIDETIYKRIGAGQFTKYNESANSADPLSFDFEIGITGPFTLTP